MRWLVTIQTGLLCLLVLVYAGCDSSGSPHPGISPQADAALRSMSDTLGSAKALSFHALGTMDETLANGQNVQLERETTITMARPDKLYVEAMTDDLTEYAWYDGKTLTLLNIETNEYASIDAPPTVEKMLDHVVETYDLTLPLADVLIPNIYDSLTANIESGWYVGLHTVNSHDCHHLAFVQKNIDWQIWIDAGQTAVPRKLLIRYKLEPGQPQYTALMDEWYLTAQPSDEDFAFSPPDDATKVELSEFLPGQGE